MKPKFLDDKTIEDRLNKTEDVGEMLALVDNWLSQGLSSRLGPGQGEDLVASQKQILERYKGYSDSRAKGHLLGLMLGPLFGIKLYEHYEKEDNHFIFGKARLNARELLSDARDEFLSGKQVEATQHIVDFCRLNRGTILERDFPFSVVKVKSASSSQPRARLFGGRSRRRVMESNINTTIEDIDPTRVRPGLRPSSFDPLDAHDLIDYGDCYFIRGQLIEALAFWTRSYQLDIRWAERTLYPLVAFYGIILNNFETLRTVLFRTIGAQPFGSSVYSTLAQLVALEHKATNRLTGAQQFISQHQVYELRSNSEDTHPSDVVHVVAKISKPLGKERIEQERANLSELSESIDKLELFGSSLRLPVNNVGGSQLTDCSVILQDFVTRSKTLSALFQEGCSRDTRLKHMERVVLYTGVIQRTCSGLFQPNVFSAEDYILDFTKKLSSFLNRSVTVSSELEDFLFGVAAELEEDLALFYINASLPNFLYDGTEYIKIDFESHEARAGVIELVTLISDPLVRLSAFDNYFAALYFLSSRYSLDDLMAEERVSDFMRLRTPERTTSLSEAKLFEQTCLDLYGGDFSQFRDLLPNATIYRDMTIILDRLLEIRRLNKSLEAVSELAVGNKALYSAHIGNIQESISNAEYQIGSRRKHVRCEPSLTGCLDELELYGLV